MRVSVIIATYGDDRWRQIGYGRALPSIEVGVLETVNSHCCDCSIAEARNRAAQSAIGDWLLFLDADDELAPGYLGAMERAFEQERARTPDTTALLLTPAVQRVRNGLSFPPGFWREQPLEKGNWLCVGTLIHREMFEAVGGFGDYPHGLEDWSLWLKASRNGARIVKVPDAVYRYHVNPNSKKAALWRDPPAQVAAHERVLADLCSP